VVEQGLIASSGRHHWQLVCQAGAACSLLLCFLCLPAFLPAARADKAAAVAPRPVAGLLRPVVAGQVRIRRSCCRGSRCCCCCCCCWDPAPYMFDTAAAADQPPFRAALRRTCRPVRPLPCAPSLLTLLSVPVPPFCTACLQTVKYNSKKRAGRGFTLEELKVRLGSERKKPCMACCLPVLSVVRGTPVCVALLRGVGRMRHAALRRLEGQQASRGERERRT
jgi:ribosomal protein L13E